MHGVGACALSSSRVRHSFAQHLRGVLTFSFPPAVEEKNRKLEEELAKHKVRQVPLFSLSDR